MELRESGLSWEEIAEYYGLKPDALRDALRKKEEPAPSKKEKPKPAGDKERSDEKGKSKSPDGGGRPGF